jgi:hypothetical protein
MKTKIAKWNQRDVLRGLLSKDNETWGQQIIVSHGEKRGKKCYYQEDNEYGGKSKVSIDCRVVNNLLKRKKIKKTHHIHEDYYEVV